MEDVPDPVELQFAQVTDARRKRLGIIVLGALGFVVLVVIVAVALKFREPEKVTTNPAQDLTMQYTRGQITSPDELQGRMNKAKGQELKIAATPEDKKPAPAKQTSTNTVPEHAAAPKAGSNYKKDAEIIKKYEEINPAAASGAPASAVLQIANNRASRSTFQAGGDAPGMARRTSDPSAPTLTLRDVRIRAKLEFGIISTTGNKVVAVTTEEAPGLPAGAKFLGTASFAGKRVQIQFSQVITGGQKFEVRGTAIQGNDPGLAADVEEMSGKNLGTNVAAGAAQVIANVANNVGARVTGGATQGIVDRQASDVQADQDAKRDSIEYKVPAKTPFIIYIE